MGRAIKRLEELLQMDHVCPWWFAPTFDNPLRRLFHGRDMLAPFVHPGIRALDLGCALGYFTMDMARLVGKRGRVYAVDIDQKMLGSVRVRARRNRLRRRIITRLVDPKAPELPAPVDFILAFWVIHEVPDPGSLLALCKKALAPDGAMLVVEPVVHVAKTRFKELVGMARASGFSRAQTRPIPLSHAVLLSG